MAIGTTAKDWTESPDGTRIESPLTRETAVKKQERTRTDSECVQRNAENFKNESAEKEEYTTDNQNPTA